MSSTSPSNSPPTSSKLLSTSPPRTPPEPNARPSNSSPGSDESSIIDDLSFDYVYDKDGNYVRLSKGSSSKSNYSSPPTPQNILPPQPDSAPVKPVSPPSARRSSLSRSESAHPVLVSTTASSSQADSQMPRSFQRVSSGPVAINKARPFPRRANAEESSKQRTAARSSRNMDSLQHEKENILTSESESALDNLHSSRAVPSRASYSRSGLSGDPISRQMSASQSRPTRTIKSTASIGSISKFTNGVDYSIPESRVANGPEDIVTEQDSEPEQDPQRHRSATGTPFPSTEESAGHSDVDVDAGQSALPPTRSRHTPTNSGREPGLNSSAGTRPRRSASLSDALANEANQNYQPNPRAAANDIPSGARRVTMEDSRPDYKKYRKEMEEMDQPEPEPPREHLQPSSYPNARATGHRRRDSDTLRSGPMSAGLNSPTVMDAIASRNNMASPNGTNTRMGRASPSGARLGRVSPPTRHSPGARIGRVSPSTSNARVGRVSPPTTRAAGRISPAMSAPSMQAKRNSTALESLNPRAERSERALSSRTPTIGEHDEEAEANYASERERERESKRLSHHQAMEQQYMRAAPAPPVAAAPPAQLNRHMVVNKKAYARLDMIGKGGSSRVFRVLNHANELYAIKRVSLDKTDAETMSGYMNEIALLKRLEGNSRIIRLIDSEVKPGPGGSRGHLLLVMECGEVDLARLISERVGEPLNMVWVSYYWQQMMQAVHVIHEEKIVHSDLKPANFVLVRGQLKLIDFGIANAIANDTTNIQRDHQIGTVNFMSPEAIELPDGMRRLKVGRPSDVWSLGCILYQMVYGQPPFHHLSVYQKMKAIPDLSHEIDFPEYSTPTAPAPRLSNGAAGAGTPPKKLEHLKRKVHSGVIMSMKSCLDRNPKERATIPELLDHEWLSMKEPETPTAKPALANDETIINPYYMRQLLEYGIKLGKSSAEMDSEKLLAEAERLVAELKSIQ